MIEIQKKEKLYDLLSCIKSNTVINNSLVNRLDTSFLLKVEPKINESISNDIVNYSNYSYKDINNALLKKHPSSITIKHINNLNKAISLSRNPINNLVVYHGTSTTLLDKCVFIKDNSIYINPSTFISTSLDSKIALGYSDFENDKPLILEIEIPVNSSVLWMKPLSIYEFEYELLLNDYTLFEVQSTRVVDNYPVITVRPVDSLELDERIIRKYYDKIYNKISDYSKNILTSYTYDKFVQINKSLIDNNITNDIKNDILGINRCINMSKNPIDNLVVYHETNKKILDNCTLQKDDIPYIKLTSFISTSIDKTRISLFKKDDPLTMEIILPINYPSLWLRPVSINKLEKEILLPNNSTFEILDYITKTKNNKLENDVIKVKAIKM